MLIDMFERRIDYLRVSVTKQCNFRCQYCMPDTPEDFVDKSALPLPQMLEFIKLAIDQGIKKIRITGGEPLLRPDLCEFIAGIKAYAPSIELTLTTNAFLLERYARALKDSGLGRINISLDSLRAERVRQISKRDALPQILRGIESARALGFGIKLNMVPLVGVNDDEIVPMLEFGAQRGFGVRYIEFMENIHAKSGIQGLRADEILRRIGARYPTRMEQKECFGPAKLYSAQMGEKALRFGIISPHEDDFCKSCNRLRLTSDGIICPCLYYQESVNVSKAIASGDRRAMEELLRLSVRNKPEKNQWESQMSADKHSTRAFYYTGG